jgi:hypothetical protein
MWTGLMQRKVRYQGFAISSAFYFLVSSHKLVLIFSTCKKNLLFLGALFTKLIDF